MIIELDTAPNHLIVSPKAIIHLSHGTSSDEGVPQESGAAMPDGLFEKPVRGVWGLEGGVAEHEGGAERDAAGK